MAALAATRARVTREVRRDLADMSQFPFAHQRFFGKVGQLWVKQLVWLKGGQTGGTSLEISLYVA